MPRSIREVLITVAAAAILAQTPVGAEPRLPGFPALDAFYRERPSMVERRSSGWNPANRAHWLLETRLAPPGTSAALARKAAFDERRRRAAGRRGDETSGWFSTGPFTNAGRVNDLDFDPRDPSVVYLATAGGLWRSDDAGSTWLPRTDSLPVNEIGAVCVLPRDPDVVLIGTGLGSASTFLYRQGGSGAGPFGIGILRSTDGGASWEETSLGYPLGGSSGFSVIEANPVTGTLLAGSNAGLFRSTDDGETWTLVRAGGNYWDVKWKPGSATRVYLAKGRDPFLNDATDNGVYASDDDGLTWSLAGAGQPPGANLSQIKVGVTPADPSVVYAHYGEITTHATLGLYRSTDDGATWEVRNDTENMSINQSWYNCVLAVDPDDADRIVTGGVHLYRSDDGGLTLNQLTAYIDALGTPTRPHVDFHAIGYLPGSTSTLWVGSDGGPWRSFDDGVTWEERRRNLPTFTLYGLCVSESDEDFQIAASQDNALFGETGGDWTYIPLIGDGMDCFIDPTDSSRLYGETQNGGLHRSTNGGASWVQIDGPVDGSPIWVAAFEMDPNDYPRIFTARSTGIWRSTTQGATWLNVSSHRARSISVSPVDGNVVWTLSNSSGVWRSDDGGIDWEKSLAWPMPGLETRILADPVDPAAAFVTVAGYATGNPHILRTVDAGESWQDVTGDYPDQPANTILVDPDLPTHWYVGSDTGVWRSTDGGAHWIPFGTGLANGVVTALELHRASRKLLAGTFGRAVWEVNLGSSVGVPFDPTVAPGAMLDVMGPHPARHALHLRWAAALGTPATVTLYDVLGREVRRVDEANGGTPLVRSVTVELDGIRAGTYFAVVASGKHRVTRRIVVID